MANGASSIPGGSLFGVPAQATPQVNEDGNNNQSKNSNQDGVENNDSIDELVTRLTSGTVIGNNDDAGDGGNNQSVNGNQNQNNGDNNESGKQAEGVIADLMKVYKGDSITEGIDMDAIAEKLSNGDLSGVMDAMGTTANKAVERAINSVLTLIPEIISQTEQRVLKQVGELNTSDRVWDAFLAEHPDYAAHKGAVRDQLQRALDNGVPQDQAFAAVDMIFGNLKKKKPASSREAFSPDSGSEAFDLSEYGM